MPSSSDVIEAGLPAHVQFARLLKPFPTRRLADAVYQVNAHANAISGRVTTLLIDPPRDVEGWEFEMTQIETMLIVLASECDDALPKIQALHDDAPAAWESTVKAARAMLEGLRDAT